MDLWGKDLSCHNMGRVCQRRDQHRDIGEEVVVVVVVVIAYHSIYLTPVKYNIKFIQLLIIINNNDNKYTVNIFSFVQFIFVV